VCAVYGACFRGAEISYHLFSDFRSIASKA
jgi:hypothetical protein